MGIDEKILNQAKAFQNERIRICTESCDLQTTYIAFDINETVLRFMDQI